MQLNVVDRTAGVPVHWNMEQKDRLFVIIARAERGGVDPTPYVRREINRLHLLLLARGHRVWRGSEGVHGLVFDTTER